MRFNYWGIFFRPHRNQRSSLSRGYQGSPPPGLAERIPA